MAKFQIDRGESDRASLTSGAVQGSTRSKACSSCLIGIGLILGCGSLIAGLMLPKKIDQALIDASVICSADSDNYEAWAHPTEAGATLTYDKPSNRYFYVYNIKNALEYVKTIGVIPDVQELGPYVSKCYSGKFDVKFDEKKPTVSYKSYGYCEFDDKSTSNCEDCKVTDLVHQLNAGWGQVLTSAGNEGLLFLTASGCAPENIGAMSLMNLANPSAPMPCNWATGKPDSYPIPGKPCGCCIPDSVDTSVSPPAARTGASVRASIISGAFGAMPNYYPMACTGTGSLTGDDSKVVQAVSTLAMLDHGIYTGRDYVDPETDPEKKKPDFKLFSPLIVEKTVKQLAFGYPSALTGYLVQQSVIGKSLAAAAAGMEAAYPGSTAITDTANTLYAAYQVAKLQAKIKGLMTDVGSGWSLAGYTAEVVQACAMNCDPSKGGCAGPAINLGGKKYLDGTDCQPLTATLQANMGCAKTDYLYFKSISAQNPDPCMCGDGSPFSYQFDGAKYSGTMCCLAQGTAGTTAMTGQGCLASIPGFLQSRNLYTESEGTAFYSTKKIAILEDTGCDSSKLGEDVMEVLEANEVTEAPIWYKDVIKTPTFQDVQNFQNVANKDKRLFVEISGKDGGTQIQATGLKTRAWATAKFNDNKPSTTSFDVYVSQVSHAVHLYHEGPHSFRGVDMQRYIPSDDLLVGSCEGCAEKKSRGVGVTDGLAIATFAYGFPIAVSHPNFLFGAASLYTDISLKQVYDYDTKKKLPAPLAMTGESVKSQGDRFKVAIDIEPSTGKAMLGHNRLMASLYAYGCDVMSPDPYVKGKCGIFQRSGKSCVNPYSLLLDFGWACSAANILSPSVKGDVFIPTYWIDEWSELPEDSASKLVALSKMLQMVDAGTAVGGVIGLVIFFFGLISLCMGARK